MMDPSAQPPPSLLGLLPDLAAHPHPAASENVAPTSNPSATPALPPSHAQVMDALHLQAGFDLPSPRGAGSRAAARVLLVGEAAGRSP